MSTVTRRALDSLWERVNEPVAIAFRPIIQSVLDLDLYKLTMGRFVFRLHRGRRVKYAFRNRTRRINLGFVINESELRRQLDHCRTLKLTSEERAYLYNLEIDGQKIFRDVEYLEFLENLELPEYDLRRTSDGNFELEFSGEWAKAIYWETFALSIVNELYFREVLNQKPALERVRIYEHGKWRLDAKIWALTTHPQIKFLEFGTRRRFSASWQEYVVASLALNLLPSQFLGTSNVHLARKYSLKPSGTMAHELFMAYLGIYWGNGSDAEIVDSHARVLRDWEEFFGPGVLSTALSDTFGSDFFFREFTDNQALTWRATRQDSGNPREYARKAIKFYTGRGIDPKTKTIVFSDGLTLDKIVELEREFSGLINVVFGWGTNLTNDLGLEALSLVVKLVEAEGRGTVKLSDNIKKALGLEWLVERVKAATQYANTTHEDQECIY